MIHSDGYVLRFAIISKSMSITSAFAMDEVAGSITYVLLATMGFIKSAKLRAVLAYQTVLLAKV